MRVVGCGSLFSVLTGLPGVGRQLGSGSGRSPVYCELATFVPESFSALYLDGRKRLTITKAELSLRSEFCEDLANVMTGHCSTVHFRDGVAEVTVPERCLAGLRHAESGVSA